MEVVVVVVVVVNFGTAGGADCGEHAGGGVDGADYGDDDDGDEHYSILLHQQRQKPLQ